MFVYTLHSWELQAFVLQQLCTQQVICINILCSGRENRKQTPFFLNHQLSKGSNMEKYNSVTYITSKASSTATSSTTSTPTTRFLLTARSTHRKTSLSALNGCLKDSLKWLQPITNLRSRCMEDQTSRDPDPVAPSAHKHRRTPGSPSWEPPTIACTWNAAMTPPHQDRAPFLAGEQRKHQERAEVGPQQGRQGWRWTDEHQRSDRCHLGTLQGKNS